MGSSADKTSKKKRTVNLKTATTESNQTETQRERRILKA